MDQARQLIKMAAMFAESDCIKFQKRSPKELLTEEEYRAPHPVPHNAFGTTYGEHREFLEFNLDQHKQLVEWCQEFDTEYSCSVWDLSSAKDIVSLSPKWIKIPSACNLNRSLLDYLASNFGGQIHISLGMTTQKEEDQIVEFIQSKGRSKDCVLYACTSGYPVSFQDVSLLEIPRLIGKFGNIVAGLGFSGHHLGIAVDVAALTLGAKFIERHFTLDRTLKGTDHAASLEPDGLRRLVRDIRHVAASLDYKQHEVLSVEKEQRRKLKESQVRWE